MRPGSFGLSGRTGSSSSLDGSRGGSRARVELDATWFHVSSKSTDGWSLADLHVRIRQGMHGRQGRDSHEDGPDGVVVAGEKRFLDVRVVERLHEGMRG